MSDKTIKPTLSSLVLGTLVLTATYIAAPAYADATDSPLSKETTSALAPLSPDIVSDKTDRKYSPEELDDIGGDPRVIEYWTPERMAQAIPVETPVAPHAHTVESDEVEWRGSLETHDTVVAEPTEATGTHKYAMPKSAPVTNFRKTNGKVFYRNATDGRTYSCSGSAINSGSKRLVSTAGHCVHGGPGGSAHMNFPRLAAATSEEDLPAGSGCTNTPTILDWDM